MLFCFRFASHHKSNSMEVNKILCACAHACVCVCLFFVTSFAEFLSFTKFLPSVFVFDGIKRHFWCTMYVNIEYHSNLDDKLDTIFANSCRKYMLRNGTLKRQSEWGKKWRILYHYHTYTVHNYTARKMNKRLTFMITKRKAFCISTTQWFFSSCSKDGTKGGRQSMCQSQTKTHENTPLRYYVCMTNGKKLRKII